MHPILNPECNIPTIDFFDSEKPVGYHRNWICKKGNSWRGDKSYNDKEMEQ